MDAGARDQALIDQEMEGVMEALQRANQNCEQLKYVVVVIVVFAVKFCCTFVFFFHSYSSYAIGCLFFGWNKIYARNVVSTSIT